MTSRNGLETSESLSDLARRIDDLREKVSHEGPKTQELLGETIEAITAFNRLGLAALVKFLRADPRGTQLLYEAVDLPEVMALMASHNIIRTDLTLEVLRVVDQLRPHLMAASVNLEVLRVEGDVVSIRYNSHRPDDEVVDGIHEALLARVVGLREVREVVDAVGTTFVALDQLKVRSR